MKKFTVLAFAFFAAFLLATSPADARIAPLRALFISGSAEYESDKTMPILKKYLESKYPSLVTIISAKGDGDLPAWRISTSARSSSSSRVA